MIKNKKSSSLVDSIWIRETEFWHYWVWFLKTNLNPDRTDHHDKNADSALKQLKWAWGDLVTACMNLDESHDPDLRKRSMLTDFLFKCNLIVDRQCGFVRSCIYPNSPPHLQLSDMPPDADFGFSKKGQLILSAFDPTTTSATPTRSDSSSVLTNGSYPSTHQTPPSPDHLQEWLFAAAQVGGATADGNAELAVDLSWLVGVCTCRGGTRRWSPWPGPLPPVWALAWLVRVLQAAPLKASLWNISTPEGSPTGEAAVSRAPPWGCKESLP